MNTITDLRAWYLCDYGTTDLAPMPLTWHLYGPQIGAQLGTDNFLHVLPRMQADATDKIGDLLYG